MPEGADTPEVCLEESQREKWDELARFVNANYLEPDLACMEATYASAYAHFLPQQKGTAVWLQVVGRSGSGKTVLCIDPLMALPEAEIYDKVNPKGLLSGFGDREKKKKGIKTKYAILERCKDRRIWLFPDLSTLLGRDKDTQNEMNAALRRLYDGHYSASHGSLENNLAWDGKLTIIGAVTHVAEDGTMMSAALGDRFFSIKYHTPDDPLIEKKQILAAMKISGRGDELSAGLKTRLGQVLAIRPRMAEFPDDDMEKSGLIELLYYMTYCRQPVVRKSKGLKDSTPRESANRMGSMITGFCKAHAGMMGYDKVSDRSLKLARRIILDSVPSRRSAILESLSQGPLSTADLEDVTGIGRSALLHHSSELQILKLIKKEKETDGTMWWQLSEMAKELRKSAGLEG